MKPEQLIKYRSALFGRRIYATIYADSSRTTQVDYKEFEIKDPVEWPLISIGSA